MTPSTSNTSPVNPHKRRFQPSIKSYFSPGDPTPSTAEIYTTVPSLPPQIQSSLLNLGMRIRKSVPEGYKTKSSSLTTSAKTKTLLAAARSCSGNGKQDAQVRLGDRRRAAELMPFCGLHDVGNFAVQEHSLVVGEEEEEGDDDLPPLVFEDFDADAGGFGSSQESNESVRTVGPFAFYGSVRAVGDACGSGNKRIWEEDEEGEDQHVGDRDRDRDGSVGGERGDMDVGVGLRPIAQPKTRRSRRRRMDAVGGQCMWKEGMEGVEEECKEWVEGFRVEEWMDVDF